jgi:nicotinamide phosphoribosyltransferase
MHINPLTAIDFYKTDHRRQYPDGTTEVYANFTPRSDRLAKIWTEGWDHKIVFFGLRYFIKDFLIDAWQKEFFDKEKSVVVAAYKRRLDNALGKDAVDISHIEALHDVGYLPLLIKALPEGSRVPIGVPVLTIVNTHPDFFWLTNYIETVLSCYLWKAITSATTAFEYRRLLTKYADLTGVDRSFIDYQAHDFSFRGMSSLQDAAISGAAHLLSFVGTDSIPAIDLLEHYYGAACHLGNVGCSVAATEHSVMSMAMQDAELVTFRRLINDIYPAGIVSIVSDTWDFWKVVTEYLVELKEEILEREGKVVIRPDSGDPVKIIVGDKDAPIGSPQHKGAVECLFDIFGGTETSTGHKVLDSHIGLIYGDSITIERAEEILNGLEKKGFASANIILGIGSYTYQYVTRDNFGFAVKATSGIVNGERRDIFKSPKTDSGDKKSAKGLLRVEREVWNGSHTFVLHDNQSEEQEKQGILATAFMDGAMIDYYPNDLQDIRVRLHLYYKNKG